MLLFASFVSLLDTCITVVDALTLRGFMYDSDGSERLDPDRAEKPIAIGSLRMSLCSTTSTCSPRAPAAKQQQPQPREVQTRRRQPAPATGACPEVFQILFSLLFHFRASAVSCGPSLP